MKHLKVILLAALVVPFASRAEEPQKTQFDVSGWLVLSGFNNQADFDSRDLPRFALPETANNVVDQRASGFAVRQSRIRAGLTMPTDNYLAGSVMKGLLEADFAGGAAGTTVDGALPRLRHAYLAASWKQAANLTLLVGQTWGVAVAPASGFPVSLAHLAVPRLGGAGFLYRRAPQIRLSMDAPAGPVTLTTAFAVLAPGDISSSTNSSPGNDAAYPNLEGRVALGYKDAGVVKNANLGFMVHYGRERFGYGTAIPGAAANAQAANATSQLVSLEGRADFGYVAFLGGAWRGQNLDAFNSIAGLQTFIPTTTNQPVGRFGVLFDVSDPTHPQALEIKTLGVYGQLLINPVKSVQLALGVGFENPDDATLKLPTAAALGPNMILRNTQYTGAAIWSVTSKWQVSFEATRYMTFRSQAIGLPNDTITGNQFEIGSIFSI
jgi:hypothetical protein